MKLEQLCEGLIKIPEPLLQACMDRVVSVYLSQLSVELGDRLPVHTLNDIVNHYDGVYEINLMDIPKGKSDRVSFRIPKAMVDPRYNSKEAKSRVLRMIVGDVPKGYEDAAGLVDTDKKTFNTMYIRTTLYLEPNVLNRVIDNPDIVHLAIQKLRGVTEHELTHVMQRDYLSAKHRIHRTDDVQYHGDTGIDLDAHTNTELEKDPLIKSSINDFIMLITGYEKIAQKPLSKDKKRYIYSYFTDPSNEGLDITVPVPRGGVTKLAYAGLDTPLRTWFNKDKDKWKRAAKYFYTAVAKYL